MLVAAVVWTSGRPASAQPVDPAAEIQAREQLRAGVEAVSRGAWNEARTLFARALQIAPLPLALLNLAGAEAETGHLVAAVDAYRRFLRLDAAAIALYRADALRALAVIEPRIPHLSVQLSARYPRDEVLLDGRALAPAVLEAPIPVDPGARELVVRRAGALVARTTVDAREGISVDVLLRVPAPPDGGRVRGPVVTVVRLPPPPVAIGLLVGGLVVGVGGAGTAAGAWVASGGIESVLVMRCGQAGPCTAPDDIALAMEGQRLEVASTVGLVVGVVGAAVALVGGVWLAAAPRTATRVARQRGGLAWQLRF